MLKRFSSISLLLLSSMSVSAHAGTSPATKDPCLVQLFQKLGNPSSRDLTLQGPSQIATLKPQNPNANAAYLNFDQNGQGAIGYSCLPNKMPNSCNYFTGASVSSCQVEDQRFIVVLNGNQASATLTLSFAEGELTTPQVHLSSSVQGISPSEDDSVPFTRK